MRKPEGEAKWEARGEVREGCQRGRPDGAAKLGKPEGGARGGS